MGWRCCYSLVLVFTVGGVAMSHYDEQREQRMDVIDQNGNTGEHYDAVNNPKHYDFAPGIEAIDVIEATLTTEQFRGYLIGNSLKYRLRAGDKGDALQDIAKAKWYQDRVRKL